MSNLISTIWSSQKYLLVPGLDRTSFQPRLTRFVLDKLSLLLWLKGVNGGLRYVEIVRRAVKIWGWIKIEVKFSERGPLIDLRLTCGSGLESKMISVYTKYYVQMAFNIQLYIYVLLQSRRSPNPILAVQSIITSIKKRWHPKSRTSTRRDLKEDASVLTSVSILFFLHNFTTPPLQYSFCHFGFREKPI